MNPPEEKVPGNRAPTNIQEPHSADHPRPTRDYHPVAEVPSENVYSCPEGVGMSGLQKATCVHGFYTVKRLNTLMHKKVNDINEIIPHDYCIVINVND